MSLPAANWPCLRQSFAEIFVEETLEKFSCIQSERRIRIADANIDPTLPFRKQPAVIGRDQRIENHLDMIGFKGDIFPPAHDRLDEMPRTALEAKPRMGSIGNYGIIGMNLTAICAAK